jgi:hypothetical protein
MLWKFITEFPFYIGAVVSRTSDSWQLFISLCGKQACIERHAHSFLTLKFIFQVKEACGKTE